MRRGRGNPSQVVGGEVAVTGAPGLGIELDRDRVEAAHAVYPEPGPEDRDDAIGHLIPGWTFDTRRTALVR